jgi:hypothetical protein
MTPETELAVLKERQRCAAILRRYAVLIVGRANRRDKMEMAVANGMADAFNNLATKVIDDGDVTAEMLKP